MRKGKKEKKKKGESSNPLEEFKDWTFGQLAALGHKLGGPEAVEEVLRNDELSKQVAAIIARGAKKATIKFIVADMFKVGNAAVKISWIGDHFQFYFYGMTEAKDAAVPCRHHSLVKDSLDPEIISDIGGEVKAEVTLVGIYELLKLQPCGEDEDLLTNGCANIFYVRDKGGFLRAVGVYWDGGGWRVDASSVGDPYGWDAGRRVFSRPSNF